MKISCLEKEKFQTNKPLAMRVVEDALAYSENLPCYNNARFANRIKNKGGIHMDGNSLSHTKRNCKYHIVFAPKYRRQIIYGRIKADIGKILRDLCNRKNVDIIEAECCPDHIHMLVTIPPHLSISSFMGYLKSKSSLMIFDKHANLKYKYGNRHFWCRGYYVDTVGRYEGAIKEYIRNQLQEDIAQDTLNFKEYTDPFTGEPVK